MWARWTRPASSAASATLSAMEIVSELAGQRRYRVFKYEAYLEIPSEGA